MTNREWLMEQMQNMSDEEFADERDLHDFICAKVKCCEEYSDIGCNECKLNWLKAEHKEKPKLSEVERVILENVDTVYSWIARTEGGHLMLFECKPKKDTDIWYTGDDGYYTSVRPFNHLFQFIKWEDTEAYNIEELLKG